MSQLRCSQAPSGHCGETERGGQAQKLGDQGRGEYAEQVTELGVVPMQASSRWVLAVF